MMLAILLLTMFLCGLLVLLCGQAARMARALAYAGFLFGIIVFIVIGNHVIDMPVAKNEWLLEWSMPWISSFNINFHLGLNGLSFWFSVLALVMGILAVFGSAPKTSPSLFYAAILWTTTGVLGIFLAADVFLFFIFWEATLLPIYLMLIVFGHGEKFKASLRYIIYTQGSGLFLLLSIVGTVYAHYRVTGAVSFNYQELSKRLVIDPEVQGYLLLGFLLAFLIKLPAFPFHGWMPAFFSSAPAPLILVAILVKTSVFGLLRFSWPLLPDASAQYSLPVMFLGAISMIYGAVVAFGKQDPKSIMAYATFSHAGLLLMGIFSPTPSAFFGVPFLTMCQALSTSGILLLLAKLYGKDTVLALKQMGGLWQKAPQSAVFLLAYLLASIGVPVFGNFIGEWLILWGAFNTSLWIAVFASFGIIAGTVYSLWLFQRLCFGAATTVPSTDSNLALKTSELTVFSCLLIILVALGLMPNLVSKPKSFAPFTASSQSTDSALASDK